MEIDFENYRRFLITPHQYVLRRVFRVMPSRYQKHNIGFAHYFQLGNSTLDIPNYLWFKCRLDHIYREALVCCEGHLIHLLVKRNLVHCSQLLILC